jgi:hypothetical protein
MILQPLYSLLVLIDMTGQSGKSFNFPDSRGIALPPGDRGAGARRDQQEDPLILGFESE